MVGWGPGVASRIGPRMGVRARSVLVAVVVVSLALLAGGSALVYALEVNLESSAESTARERAAAVVALINSAGIDVASAGLAEASRSGQVVQIITADGTVSGSSSRLVAARPMSPQRPAVGEYLSIAMDIDQLGERGEWKVVSTAVVSGASTFWVQVAVPIRVQRETVQTVAIFLLGATPLLLAGVAAAVWLLVGRALRPVERIRTAVSAVDAHRLTARLEVPRTRDEIAALAATMNVMLDRLQASHQAQRAFVSDASHELRSPLATLTTAAELAAGADEPTRTRLLGTINLELTRMRGLVDNLMTLARSDAQDLPANCRDVDVDDLLNQEVHRLRTTSPRLVETDLQPARAWGDEQRLVQALRNLLDNAERHASSTIRLTLRTAGDQAVLWVDNDGEVIDVGARDRIFERFVRLDDSRSRDAGGSGLGLAIARSELRSQSGDVAVVDAPDGWCRFELRVPLTAPTSDQAPNSNRAPTSDQAPTSDRVKGPTG